MAEIIQGSPDWFAVRLGKVTASKVAAIVAKTKTGPSASRKNYMGQLIAERLTGQAAPSFTSAEMQHGIDTEPAAREAYEFYRNTDVVQVGFVRHPTIAMAGASPDGLVGDDGLVEIKCPTMATHIDTLLGKAVMGEYQTQIQWQLACTGREWCDFVSYDPRMSEAMKLFICRVERDDARIAKLEAEVRSFLSELDDKVRRLRAEYDPPAPLTPEQIAAVEQSTLLAG